MKFANAIASMIKRAISTKILEKLTDEKAIIVLGPRQAGKSTLVQQLAAQFKQPVR